MEGEAFVEGGVGDGREIRFVRGEACCLDQVFGDGGTSAGWGGESRRVELGGLVVASRLNPGGGDEVKVEGSNIFADVRGEVVPGEDVRSLEVFAVAWEELADRR